MTEALARFSAEVCPVALLIAADLSITAGEHTLILAPTGSGKTLAAFHEQYPEAPAYMGVAQSMLPIEIIPVKEVSPDIVRHPYTGELGSVDPVGQFVPLYQ